MVYTATETGGDVFTIDVNSTGAASNPATPSAVGYAYTYTVENYPPLASQAPLTAYVEDDILDSTSQTDDFYLYPGLWEQLNNSAVPPNINLVDALEAIPGQYVSLVVPPKYGTFVTSPAQYSASTRDVIPSSGEYIPPTGFTGTDSFTLDVHAVTAASTGTDPQFFDAELTYNYTYVPPSLPMSISSYNGQLTAQPSSLVNWNTESSAGSSTYYSGASGIVETVTTVSDSQLTVTVPNQPTYTVTQGSNGSIVVMQNGQTVDTFAQPTTPTLTPSEIAAGTIFSQTVTPPQAASVAAIEGEPAIVSLPDLSIAALAAGNYQIVSPPQEGTVAVNAGGQIAYTATSSSSSTDNFQIEAAGNRSTVYAGDPVVYTVSVTVSKATAVPPPTMTANVSVSNGASATLDIFGMVTGVNSAEQTTSNGEDTSIVIVDAPQHGTLSFGTASSSGQFYSVLAPFFGANDPIYTPDAGYSGSDSMTVEVHGLLPTTGGQSTQYFDTLLTIDFTVTAAAARLRLKTRPIRSSSAVRRLRSAPAAPITFWSSISRRPRPSTSITTAMPARSAQRAVVRSPTSSIPAALSKTSST